MPTGDLVPGADGDHLLNTKNAAYITEEDTYIEDGALILRNQKRPYHGESPQGEFDYTTGTVISMHRVHLNKGYVEMRAQWPSGDKVEGRRERHFAFTLDEISLTPPT